MHRILESPNPELCPDDVVESLDAYVQCRRPVGSFLRAVLENDLMESVGRADEYNLAALPHIVAYVYNRLPLGCWGSPEKVRDWLKPSVVTTTATF